MADTILHINTERGWRGGEAQTLRLALGLTARGHRCLLVVQPESALFGRAADAGLDPIPVPMNGEMDLLAARRIGRLVKSEGVALLHYHTAHAVGLGTLATCFSGRRPAVASRRVSFRLRGLFLGRLKYTWRVDRILAVSRAIKDRLIAQGFDAGRIVVVHSGIDPERFAAGGRERFRASLRAIDPGFREGLFLAGTAGHLAAHKGIDLFLEAAALAVPERPDLRFVVIGEGDEEPRLRRLAMRLGLLDRVLFTGFREDMPDAFAGLDLFVLSSRSGEGSPAVVKEAMAAGVPIAATFLEGLDELVEDGVHGLLTPPGNAPALARAMVLLASDAALRSRLRVAALERVREFSADRMVEATEAVYRSLLRGDEQGQGQRLLHGSAE